MAITLRRALIRLLTIIGVAAWSPVIGGLNDPFPLGRSMASSHALVAGSVARQPWLPACLLDDPRSLGIAVALCDYYRPIDDFSNADLRQVGIGLWYSSGPFVGKIAGERLDALDVYYEQCATLSLGMRPESWRAASVEIRGCEAGIADAAYRPRRSVDLGTSCWIPFTYAGIFFAGERLVAYQPGGERIIPKPEYRIGVQTVGHRSGSLGCAIRLIETEGKPSIRYAVGEEYWFCRQLGLSAAVATNPTLIACGMTMRFTTNTVSLALVNHPVLGWSKGFYADWTRRP